tara:strand:- start:10336 stop:10785 length:450 start_codon:yes stop_codon:yes gene_type:complete
MKYITSIICGILFFSCGSRKVEIQKTNTEIKTVSKEIFKTVDTSNIEVKFNYEYNTFTIEAKDNLKPFIYNNKTYLNVVLKHLNTKDNTIYKKDVKVVKTNTKDVIINSKEIAKTKIVDKKENMFKYFIILIVVFLLYLFLKFRKFFLI